MVMGILGILAVILLTAVLAGIITWKLLTRTDGNGSTGKKVYISRTGAYVDDGNLGGKSGELFKVIVRGEDGTVITEQGYGWGSGQDRGRREIVLESLTNGKTYQSNFSREIMLGREIAGLTDSPVISLSFSSVSRRHCRIFLRDTLVLAEDLGSTYGTFINEKQVLQEAEIRDQDMLQLGYEKFLVRIR